MVDETALSLKVTKERLLLPALALARFAVSPPNIASGLLLIDIAATYGQPVGIMGQMRTTSSTLSMIAAIIMAALSIRFRHKSLLLTGLGFVTLSALGCYMAPTFSTIIMVYSLVGIGTSLVEPMTMTMVGTYLPREERPRAVGWLIAGNSLSYLVGAPLIAYLAGLGSWRGAFLFWVAPVAILSIVIAIICLPSPNEELGVVANINYLDSFKAILTNRSAIACLLGSALLMASYQAMLVYGASFYRQRFLVSTGLASMFVIGGALFFTVGSVNCSRLVKRYGRKRVIFITGLVGGLFTALYMNVPSIWFSASTRFLGGMFIAFSFSALNSLTLEQVPQYRGSLMSVNSAMTGVGAALGSFIGGLALLWYGYGLVGILLGGMAVVSALITHFVSVDFQ